MKSPDGMTPQEQFQALNTIQYIEDLFTVSPKETFTRAEILVILNAVKNDPDMFDPDVVQAQAEVTRDLG